MEKEEKRRRGKREREGRRKEKRREKRKKRERGRGKTEKKEGREEFRNGEKMGKREAGKRGERGGRGEGRGEESERRERGCTGLFFARLRDKRLLSYSFPLSTLYEQPYIASKSEKHPARGSLIFQNRVFKVDSRTALESLLYYYDALLPRFLCSL